MSRVAASLFRPYELPSLARSAYADAARVLLRRVTLSELRWRHHGLGALQAELSEEIRVHVWHPDLRTLPRGGFRAVHDHRFALTSYVVVGRIYDTPFSVVPLDYGTNGPSGWEKNPIADVFAIVHAKAQGAGPVAVGLGPAYVSQEETRTFDAGDVYSLRRRDFHSTWTGRLTVTLVHRAEFDADPARVLAPRYAAHVDSAIVRENVETLALRNYVLREADDALAEALR